MKRRVASRRVAKRRGRKSGGCVPCNSTCKLHGDAIDRLARRLLHSRTYLETNRRNRFLGAAYGRAET
jgi:hypothetical protein